MGSAISLQDDFDLGALDADGADDQHYMRLLLRKYVLHPRTYLRLGPVGSPQRV